MSTETSTLNRDPRRSPPSLPVVAGGAGNAPRTYSSDDGPTFNERLEAACLSAMFNDVDALRFGLERLADDDLYSPVTRAAVKAARALVAAGDEVDAITVEARLPEHLREAFRVAMLEMPNPLAIASYCKELRAARDARRLGAVLVRAQDLVRDGASQADVVALFSDLASDTKPAGPDTLGDWFKAPAFLKPVERIQTGFADLDAALQGGIMPGSLAVLAGILSTGKSAVAVNVARRAALAGTSVFVASLEDPAIIVARKVLAAESGAAVRTLERWPAGMPELAAIQAAMRRLGRIPFSCPEMCSDLATLKTTVLNRAARGTRLFIVDQLSHVTIDAASQYERAATITRTLQATAKQSGAAVLLLCQVNRAGCQNADGPTLYDLRDSGTIEADARLVLLIKSLAADGTLTLEVAKHSFGPRGAVVRFAFTPETQRLDDYAPPPADRGAA